MEKEHVIEEIPIETLQLMLQEHLADETASITDFSTEPMQHDGIGGNDICRAKVSWTTQENDSNSVNWVIKHWYPGGLTGWGMGVSVPAEALAWNHGLIRPESLPRGLVAPFVGVIFNEESTSARIVMEDISEELSAYVRNSLSPAERLKRDRLILDRLAQFHVHWETPERFAQLEKQKWLLPQEARLKCLADFFSQCIDGQTSSGTILKGIRTRLTGYFDWAPKQLLAFLDWLSKPDRRLWEQHLCHRQALIEAFSTLPQTFLHGDTDPRNVGLRWRGKQIDILLIDWEWIGTGSPALDVMKFFLNFTDIDLAQSLSDYYYDRYVSHGGKAMDRSTWERAYDLAVIHEGLCFFPVAAGRSLDRGPEAIEQTKRENEQITQVMRKRLT